VSASRHHPGFMRWLLLVLLASCGASEENEARLILDRIDAIEAPTLDERRRRVDQLAATPVETPRVLNVRDRCAELHDMLLRSEEKTQEARQLVEGMERGRLEATEERQARVERLLEESAEAVSETRVLRAPCQDALTDVRARYDPRRE